MLSSAGSAIGTSRVPSGSRWQRTNATQTLLPHRFGRRFLCYNVLARATISFQLVTHNFYHHHLAGERSRAPSRSNPPRRRSGSTLVPRQGVVVCVARPAAIGHGQLADRSKATAAAVYSGSGGIGLRQECTEADLGHLPDSTSSRDCATGELPYFDTERLDKTLTDDTVTDFPQYHRLSSQGAQHCPPSPDPPSLSTSSRAQSPPFPESRARSCS